MKHDDLPPRWKAKLAEWLQTQGAGTRDRLGASDFPGSQGVRLDFEDGSRALFRFAIVIESPAWRELGVFTEHCGYHIFPLGGVSISFDEG